MKLIIPPAKTEGGKRGNHGGNARGSGVVNPLRVALSLSFLRRPPHHFVLIRKCARAQ